MASGKQIQMQGLIRQIKRLRRNDHIDQVLNKEEFEFLTNTHLPITIQFIEEDLNFQHCNKLNARTPQFLWDLFHKRNSASCVISTKQFDQFQRNTCMNYKVHVETKYRIIHI